MTSTRLRALIGPTTLATAARDVGRPDRCPVRDVARRAHQHERDRLARRFLSRPVAAITAAGVDGLAARSAGPRWLSSALDVVAQLVLAGQAQRGEQAEADRLAVAVAGVAGGRLDRVADRVAEVEHLARAAVALVGGHDAQLRARAADDHLVVDRCARRDALPQRARRRSARS